WRDLRGLYPSDCPEGARDYLRPQSMTDKLYDYYEPSTGRQTTVEIDPETGWPVWYKTQDTRPIVESAKRIASNFTGPSPSGVTHVARIPLVVWQRLVMTGVAKDERALNAWLNDPDNRVFRCDDGRTL